MTTLRSDHYRTDSDPGEPYFDQAPVRDPIREQDLWRRVVLAMLVDARMGIPPVFGASAAEHDAACDFSNWPRNVRRMAGGKAGLVAKWAAYCQTQWFRDIASMVEVDPVELTEEILTTARNASW